MPIQEASRRTFTATNNFCFSSVLFDIHCEERAIETLIDDQWMLQK